jgi:hypothetical protein
MAPDPAQMSSQVLPATAPCQILNSADLTLLGVGRVVKPVGVFNGRSPLMRIATLFAVFGSYLSLNRFKNSQNHTRVKGRN